MIIMVFDTETTGLPVGKNPSIYHGDKWPYIIQLSYILYDTDKNEMIGLEDNYINISSDIKISEESQKIHKISREMCDKGISIEEGIRKFNENILKCDILVGHNISFDKRMILVEGIRNKIRINMDITYCTMKNSTEICKIEKIGKNGDKYFKFPTLSELHNHLFNTIPENTHNALIDILLCLKCFCMLECKVNITEINKTIYHMLRDTNT